MHFMFLYVCSVYPFPFHSYFLFKKKSHSIIFIIFFLFIIMRGSVASTNTSMNAYVLLYQILKPCMHTWFSSLFIFPNHLAKTVQIFRSLFVSLSNVRSRSQFFFKYLCPFPWRPWAAMPKQGFIKKKYTIHHFLR